MYKGLIIIILVSFFTVYTGCASIITDINVKKSEYASIDNSESAYVVTNDSKQHEITQFRFTENQLIGKELSADNKERTIKINFSEINSLKIKGIRDDQGIIITKEEIEKHIIPKGRKGRVILGCIIGSPIGYLLTFPLCGIILGGNSLGTTGCIIIGLTSWTGGTALGGYFGYVGAKNAEIKSAIKLIQEERKNLKENTQIDGLKMKGEIVIISKRVGEVIDPEEKAQYHLFPAVNGFISAVLHKLPNDRYVFKINYTDKVTGGESVMTIPQTVSQIFQIREHIEKFD